ncbi:zinc ribbon domain-containing protein [soil metagenome]
MPTYEYLCTECGDRREVVQSFTEESLTSCQVCRGRLRKVIYPVGIQFKGSGFYSTDRRASQPMSRAGKQDAKDAKAESKDSKDSKSESTSNGKSQTKTESKSDSKKSDSGSKDGAPAKKAAEKSA